MRSGYNGGLGKNSDLATSPYLHWARSWGLWRMPWQDSPENAELLRRLWAADQELRDAREKQLALRALLLEQLGDNETATVSGRNIITLQTRTYTRFDLEAFKIAHPALHEEFRLSVTSRTLVWKVKSRRKRNQSRISKGVQPRSTYRELNQKCATCGGREWLRQDDEVMAQCCPRCDQVRGKCKRCGSDTLALSYNSPECLVCDGSFCWVCGSGPWLADRLSDGRCERCYASGDDPRQPLIAEESLQDLVDAGLQDPDPNYEGWPDPTPN